jgi:eukaryotic-like serine/threonine-protein kinase
MTSERWRRIEELFHAALERGASVLADADPDIQREVEGLLAQRSREGIPGILDRDTSDGSDASTRTPTEPGSQLGPYRIEAVLGQGGMGRVFRALDPRLGRHVAIKVSQQRFTERSEREARAIAALNHPHVCTVHDVGPNYLVMELVDGETLAARLKRGKLPTEQTIAYGAQIASALAAAHAKGIVHRDLKPGNIMVTRSGVKVLDFGLARAAQDEPLTAANMVLGTPGYMAPEQRAGKPCDARTDIYALGLVLHEMATGILLAPGEQTQVDSLPEKLGHVVERCLARDPDDRWQSANDLKSELEWAGRAAPGRDLTERRWQPGRWRLTTAAVAIAAAIGALAAAALVYVRKPTPAGHVVRSTILPPAKTSFDFAANLGPAALSPDGTRIVFAATGGDGQSQLWLRALDSLESRPLPGTENATFPFWSPDSRWVAFFANKLLKKVDIQGGTPVPLTAAGGGGIGGSWGAKGQIVFAGSAFSPLLKVSSDGGDASLAAETQVSGQGLPWFLPDGEHFLFASWVGAGRLTLRVGSLGSTKSQAIGEADSSAIYADGRLLYLQGDSLMAQLFDVKTLHTTGEAALVAEHVQRFLGLVGAGMFSASATNLLAYQRGSDAAVSQLTWFDRTGEPVGTLGKPRAFFDVEVSPDGTTALASAPDEVGNYDLWKYDLERDLATRFTTDPAGEYYGVWSDDGRSVIFNSTRRGHYDLYRKPADGAGPEELVYADDTDKVPLSWSHDGRYLLYMIGGGRRYELRLLSLTPERPGSALKVVPFLDTRFNERWAEFSPDGRWVAYETDESGRSEIYAVPFSKPTEEHQISRDGGSFPRWRRDGKGIVYREPDGQLEDADVRISGDTVEVPAVRPVFARVGLLGGGFPYGLSADGERVLAVNPTARSAEPITLVENWTAALKP